ncbi:alpha/beta fold hydrolase [Budvicia aquatica]|uniref:Alpha/beta hydrolase n=2 Tax=Budvicia aquatica TaxID=82979 RepID=A0A2C6DIX0_9GAMM|nr:alpha/beta fold hydrolase [Budvicia aquatica]PHI30248.1 alpha/beta hydrolase [Budvicia aquatica]
MKLNYRLQGNGPIIVLLHGLFGNLDNLGVIARDLQHDFQTLQVDLRNHGLSPHSSDINYRLMAEDLLSLFDELALNDITVVGHSMGGKVAMMLTELAAERIARLVIIDMAPVAYPERHHDDVFAALNAVTESKVTQRTQAAEIMRKSGLHEGVISFLLKSFNQGEWRFNVPALQQHYSDIIGWHEVSAWNKPVMFIRGELSPYIQDSYRPAIARQFPQARAYVAAGCGHWVHAEKPQQVIRVIRKMLPS